MRKRFFHFAGRGGVSLCLGRIRGGLGVGPVMLQVPVEEKSASYF